MLIQLDFHNALFVSFEKEPDVLELNFGDPEIFISAEGISISLDKRKISRELVKQLPIDS